MSSLKKLDKAKLLLHQHLPIILKTINFEPKLARIHVILRDNVQIFIKYLLENCLNYQITFKANTLFLPICLNRFNELLPYLW